MRLIVYHIIAHALGHSVHMTASVCVLACVASQSVLRISYFTSPQVGLLVRSVCARVWTGVTKSFPPHS